MRVAVDIGGTFTDAAVLNEETGEVTVSKSSTTPLNPVLGVIDCIRKLGIENSRISYFVHGTTVATNAVVQRKFPPMALVCTKGFADIIEITRGNRPLRGLFDIRWEKPKPIVPRYLRFEVTERIDKRGRVLTPLNEEDARRVARTLKSNKIMAVGICFLFSFMNAHHENRMLEIIKEEHPEAHVSISSSVNPEIREYERVSTVVIDAAVKPVMDHYIRSLEEGLRASFETKLMIMKANGGMMSAAMARAAPVHTIESGPAGGVIGASSVASATGIGNLIAIDMGGTTFKVSIIEGGAPRHKSQGELEWGVPFRIPMIDISEIGAGGGSIAWIDEAGLLKVGPASAGADPGPACYALGGVEPTITDAQLVLGRLAPDYFLGGEMKLDKTKSIQAIKKLADRMGMDVVNLAAGIVRIAEAKMLDSMRVNSVSRGYDPRDFSVIAYGGAGPMIACTLASELGCHRVLIPFHPGIFSAIGMLAADIRFDFMQTYITKVDEIDLDRLNSILGSLEKVAKGTLSAEHEGEFVLVRSADMRYYGQNYEITTPIPGGELTMTQIPTIKQNFDVEHRKLYSHSKPDEPMEIVSLRVGIVGKVSKSQLRKKSNPSNNRLGETNYRKGTREVYFENDKGYIQCPIYERDSLVVGAHIEGPCIIEEMDSTIVVNPRQRAALDQYGNVMIEV